jgi:hypothetical protein
MYVLKLKNHKGELLELTHNTAYAITSITGLNPPAANINTVDAALLDGSTFNSSKVGMRNIVINLAIQNPAEKNRVELYRYVKTKKPCTVYFQNGRRNVYIDGYFETLDVNLFENIQMAQISIICPQPFFLDMETQTIDGLYFNAENGGDIETGATITITATGGSVVNPSITNSDTGDYFKLNYTIPEAATLTINTIRGQKGVTLTSSGTTTNLINYIVSGSTWLQLDTGANNLVCDADTGAEYLACEISYDLLYEGV